MTVVNWSRLALLLIAALVLQVAVVDQVLVAGDHADLMVLLAAAGGLVGGPQRGAVVGFCTGLFADLVLPTPYGLSLLTFVLLGFVAGLVRNSTAGRDSPGSTVLLCVIGGAVGTLGFAVIAALVGQPGMLRQATLAVAIVTVGGLVLAWPALRAVSWALAGTRRTAERYAVPSGGSAAS
ncbi:MAG: rod shape-determining protein [Acidimicrobiaceae bacterium]|nr:rod shape-determining protein [Acidimicrobiaceae bacterium]